MRAASLASGGETLVAGLCEATSCRSIPADVDDQPAILEL